MQLVLVVAVGIVAAAATGFFPVRPPQEDRLPNHLAMQIASPRGGTAMALYDRFAGYQERYYAEMTIKPTINPSPLEIPLPAGQIIGLILRVCGVDGPAPWSVDIGDVRVQAEDGALVHAFTPGDVVPGRNVLRMERGAGGLHVEPVAGADAIELELKFGGRMVLPDDSPAGRAAVRPVVNRQRWLAVLLVVCGVGVTLAVKRNRAAPRATSPGVANDVPPYWLEACAIGYATIAVVFSRRPDVVVNPQFWAEDGVIFYAEQCQYGLAAFARTYAGFLYLFPRAVAWIAQSVPARWMPACFVYATLVVVVLTTVKAASTRVALPHPYWCALAIVLVPNIGEVLLNLTNAQWFGAVLLLTIALSRSPVTRCELVADLVAVMVFGLTGPFAILCLPLFAWRCRRERTWQSLVILVLAAGAAAVEIAARAAGKSGTVAWNVLDALLALAGVGYRTVGQLVGIMPSVDWGPPVGWGYIALVLWLLLWIAFPTDPRLRRVKPMLGWAVAAVVGGGMLRYAIYPVAYFQPTHMHRYFHLPLLATLWLLIGGLTFGGWRRALAAAVLLVVVARNVSYYRVAPLVDFHWAKYATAIERGEAVSAPINPQPWTVEQRAK